MKGERYKLDPKWIWGESEVPVKRPQGRPATLTPDQYTWPRSVRLTHAEWLKFKLLGGAEWLREQIAKAKAP